MEDKSLNKIFGYIFYAIGGFKIIYVVIILIEMFFLRNGLNRGNDFGFLTKIATIMIIFQGLIFIFSLVMFFATIKNGIMIGYLISFGALVCEYILPKNLDILSEIISSILYFVAGKSLLSSADTTINKQSSKKIMQSTDWFYGDDNKEDKK